MNRWNSKVPKAVCALVCAVWLTVWAVAQVQPAPASSGSEFEWRFSIKPNQVVSSGITADNTCRRRNRFEIDTQHLPSFMRLLAESSFAVDPHKKHAVP